MTSKDPTPPHASAEHQRFWEIDPSSPRALIWPASLFVIITFFVGADLAADLAHDMSVSHVSVELVAMFFCLAGVFGSGLHLRRAVGRPQAVRRGELLAQAAFERGGQHHDAHARQPRRLRRRLVGQASACPFPLCGSGMTPLWRRFGCP